MPRDRVAKLCGADVELGNFIEGWTGEGGSGRVASRLLLREIPAGYFGYGAGTAQDSSRRFLDTNGGCAYIDLDHLELCIPEVCSAWDHVAAWHAMLRIARTALVAANARLPGERTLHVLVNNSDGAGNAYGSHVSVLVTRRAWDNLFDRKLHHLLYLASFLVSSIVFTGAGKVGAENGAPAVPFQLAQRADFFETLMGVQTTHRRPIVNSRDEPLCGSTGAAADLARVHCIFFDNTLCHGSSLLKIGALQLVLALLEADRLDPTLLLDDPVGAVVRWSHDPSLTACEPTADGAALTAVELQLRHLEVAQRFAAAGGFDGIVPRADEILALWEDTLRKLRAGDTPALAGRLDWVLKRQILEQALAAHPHLDWESPEIKYLDHAYSSLDPARGLYWAHERLGTVEQLVPAARIAHFEEEPPDDTRAWTRAMLLRRAGPDAVQDMDWDFLRIAVGGGYLGLESRTLLLEDPFGPPRATVEAALAWATSLDELLAAIGALPRTPHAHTTCYPVARI